MRKKKRDLIGREIHVIAVQPPLMHAKCDVVSDVAFCMHRIQLIYPFYRLLSSSLRTGNYFVRKTSCNADKCDEIGHMFFYSAPIPAKSET